MGWIKLGLGTIPWEINTHTTTTTTIHGRLKLTYQQQTPYKVKYEPQTPYKIKLKRVD